MATPHRHRYFVVATTWTGLRRRVLEIRTALALATLLNALAPAVLP